MTMVFAVQDETGTVTQVTLAPSPPPASPVAVGDIGIYTGVPDDGTDLTLAPQAASLPFVVTGVNEGGLQFSINTRNANMADWPANGTILWQTGGNATDVSQVVEIDGANAYITVDEFKKYHSSRGNVPPAVADAVIQAAIVQGTDYLDAKYRYSGIKLLQSLGVGLIANAAFFRSFITPFALEGASILTPSTTTQSTEWPRQGVVDFNGDTVNGIPKQIRFACAELAIRVLNGVNLQPDYDPKLVSGGGVASSITKKVGPLETTTSYDTHMGLGFFASFPIVDRMLSKAGLLNSGGGRKVIR